MTNGGLNEADTFAVIAELRDLCAKLARQWAVSEGGATPPVATEPRAAMAGRRGRLTVLPHSG
jgi:hypothetical protein